MSANKPIIEAGRSPFATSLQVPTLEHVLSTLAFQVSEIMTAKPSRTDAPYSDRVRFGSGLGGYGEGCPTVLVEVVIKPTSTEGWSREEVEKVDSWDVWAQVYTRPMTTKVDEEPNVYDGSWSAHGNRCGGREAYVKMCAPVIQWVANYWANKASEEAMAKDLQRYAQKRCQHEEVYCDDRMQTVCRSCGAELGR
jgi:hypothetical protein